LEKKLELLKAQLGYTVLTAPQDGDIATVDVDVNENVAAGQPIAKLHAGQTLEVAVSIPETLITRVHEGDPVTVVFDAQPEAVYPATVKEVGVSRQIAPAYPVKVQLLRPAPEIRSGMSAEVLFNFDNKNEGPVIFVPPLAVTQDAGQEYVYVVTDVTNNIGRVKRRRVKVATIGGQGLEIAEGLHDGDVVVTAGIQFIAEGQKVRVEKSEKRIQESDEKHRGVQNRG
jgi:RND family efflux transporter MFP subunit